MRSFFPRLLVRYASINRPAPLPLPRNDQREFERLLKTPHPDVVPPQKVAPEFQGDINPTTGEQGGPKREPVRRAAADPGGDWSFKGRVSDF